ncbi:nuclear transport factor 2 family protein [Streptomyces sp. NPDC005303]|uniref:ester cyclase n=1 Tax=Streptomyces sp. NPDC005303 TaxID=3155713 RepID=UPI0033B9A233
MRTTSLADNPSTDVGQEIWDSWTGLWNGTGGQDPAEFIADDVTVHLPTFGMPPSESLTTRDDVTRWIEGFRSCYRPGARFAAELGPWLVADELVVARWRFTGTWQGGVPATATAAAGTEVSICGVDILRLENRRIAEYWLTDDQLDLYGQLGATIPAGARS